MVTTSIKRRTRFNDKPDPTPSARLTYLDVGLDDEDRVTNYENINDNLVLVHEDQSNLTSSQVWVGSRIRHLPVLDIDFEARLVPSSTPGHYHLYLDGMKPMEERKYANLLNALADAGVIEHGYASASVARGMSLVRNPGIKRATPRVEIAGQTSPHDVLV